MNDQPYCEWEGNGKPPTGPSVEVKIKSWHPAWLVGLITRWAIWRSK